jgi:hypothetical protein
MRALVRADRHVIPIRSFHSSWYWYRKEHQTRLEFEMRGVPVPIPPPDGRIDASQVDAPVQSSSPSGGDILFKYGKRFHMEEMVKEGRVRITPASEYQNPQLGDARADDELAKHSFKPGQYSKVITQDGTAIPIIGDIRRTVSMPDYYMLCLSCDWNVSLFEAFDNADSCVVIHDVETFAQRLDLAAREHLTDWYFHYNPVQYFDPFEMAKDEYFNAGMCKDFKFAFEREYRFLWVNLTGGEANGYKYLNLGPLTDIAALCLR